MINLDFRSKLVIFISTVFLSAVIVKNSVFLLLISFLSFYTYILGYKKQLWKLLVILLIVMLMRTVLGEEGFTILLPDMFLFILTRTIALLLASIPIIKMPPGEILIVLTKLHTPKILLLSLIFMLRFFPTIGYEIREIYDSLKQRDLLKIYKPLLFIEYMFVPLMFSSTRTAEELAAAAEVRGISSTNKRTSRREIKFRKVDAFTLIIVVIAIFAILCLEWW